MQGFVGYLTNLRVPNPGFWAWPAMAAELLLGITLILGIATRYASLFAFVYVFITIVIAHRYWEYPAAQQVAQYNNFCKNLAIMGGILYVMAFGAGPLSVDRRRRGEAASTTRGAAR